MNDPRIDAALNSYPIEPLPPDFIKNTMKPIYKEANKKKATSIDLAFAGFLTIFIATLILVPAYLMISMPPDSPLEITLWLQKTISIDNQEMLLIGFVLSCFVFIFFTIIGLISYLTFSDPYEICPR